MLSTILKAALPALLAAAASFGYAQTHDLHDHAAAYTAQHASASGHTTAAHIHGAAQLQIALEGERLYIALTAPADTLLGFHGAPMTDKQQMRERAVKTLLSEPSTLWALPAQSQCRVESTDMRWPTVAQLSEHANIAAQWQFVCAAPDQLNQLPIALWRLFSGLETLHVELVTAAAAKALELTRADNKLELR